MPTGTIKKLVSDRGFGFIKAEDGQEYFFHRSGTEGDFDGLFFMPVDTSLRKPFISRGSERPFCAKREIHAETSSSSAPSSSQACQFSQPSIMEV